MAVMVLPFFPLAPKDVPGDFSITLEGAFCSVVCGHSWRLLGFVSPSVSRIYQHEREGADQYAEPVLGLHGFSPPEAEYLSATELLGS